MTLTTGTDDLKAALSLFDGASDAAEVAMAYGLVVAAKYSADQLREMVRKGEALGPIDSPSYPIGDGEDLSAAVRAVGRGSGSHDAIRRHIIKRARALGMTDVIPDNWNADGTTSGKA